jgi:lysophospholipase L1-like esterase
MERLRTRAVTKRGAPAAGERTGSGHGAARLVVCAGDSITRGQSSADYVAELERRLGPAGFEFVNAGVNGNLAWNVLQRLDDVIARRPDMVTLLVGTNDVNATLFPRWEKAYRRQQHIPQTPTLDWYRECIDAILGRLRSETAARLAVLDLPPLGEDLASEANQRVDAYNAALREVTAAHEVPCLPLHDRLVKLLPPDHRPPPYTGSTAVLLKATFGHLLLRRSFTEIARRNGLSVLADHVHLTERGAEVIADLIAESLASR